MLRGGVPLFIDIDRATGNLDAQQLLLNINMPSVNRKTVIVPVHFAGIPVDMQLIDRHIADPRTLVIEDASHALGSRYKDGSMVGSCRWSDMTVFSFHPAKTITTGEGGAVTTNNPALYQRLKLFRNNGIQRSPEFLQAEPAPWYYEVTALSSNFNFTDFQAALGLSQLKRIEAFIAKRRLLLNLYAKLLREVPHMKLLSCEKELFIAPHLCVVQIDFAACKKSRSWLMEELKQRGIGTQVHYIPLYRHPYFAQKGPDLAEHFPEMEAYYAQALSLPLYYDLSEEDVRMVVKELKALLAVS